MTPDLNQRDALAVLALLGSLAWLLLRAGRILGRGGDLMTRHRKRSLTWEG